MTFQQTLAEQYATLYIEKPDEYAYHQDAPIMAERTTYRLLMGTGAKDSEAIRRTCKQLNIAFTYNAIRAYILEEIKISKAY